MSNFLSDCINEKSFTFDALIEDMNKRKVFKKYVYSKVPYEIFINLLGGIINGYHVELLDGDLSEKDMEDINLSLEDIENTMLENRIIIQNESELINEILKNEEIAKIALYTSGTTGKPKKMEHTVSNIIRSVKIDEKNKNDIWAFAYNPTHFAGIQVFFQAIMNMNEIIYIFGGDKDIIKKAFEFENVTRISATPTFYKSIIPIITKPVNSVITVTSGGEKFEKNLLLYIAKCFPNAKIRNVYASTEAGSLFSSDGDAFIIPKRFTDKIKISDNSELLIHESLLGSSEDIEINDGYYNTKDVVDIIAHNKFKFSARNSDFINIGGYRVNPLEVEALISELAVVKDALIYGRKNSVMGNVLMVEIVKNDINIQNDEIKRQIKNHLDGKIQSWKIPNIYKFVSKIEETRSGKKVRK